MGRISDQVQTGYVGTIYFCTAFLALLAVVRCLAVRGTSSGKDFDRVMRKPFG